MPHVVGRHFLMGGNQQVEGVVVPEALVVSVMFHVTTGDILPLLK